MEATIKEVKSRSENKVDEEFVHNQYRDLANRNIKWLLIKEQIISQENITVTDDEIENYLQDMSQSQAITPEQINEIKNDKSRIEQLKNDMLENKVMKLLETHANITETEKSWREHMQRNQQQTV
jgi:trigger factor